MRIFLVILSLITTYITSGQIDLHFEDNLIAQKYRSINYTTELGLPSNETFCVFEDSRGYIWIGTDRGLVKYDGYEFKTYTTLDGLTGNCILALNEDKEGNIWYTGLNNISIGYIDPEMNFHTYKYHKQLTKYISDQSYHKIHFNEIYFDSNNIVLMNGRYGLMALNNKGEIVHDLIERTNHVATYIVDINGYNRIMTIGSKQYEFKNQVFIKNKLIGEYTRLIYKNRNPSLVFNDSVQVIYDDNNRIEIKNNIIKHNVLDRLTYAMQLSNNMILYTVNKAHDKDSKVYLSSSININDDKIEILNGCRVSKAILDRNNGLWISTLRHGVFYIPSLNSIITENNDPIESMLALEDGLIYGTINKQYYINKENHNIFELLSPPNIESLTHLISNISISNLFNFVENGEEIRYKGYFKISDKLFYTKSSDYLLKYTLDKRLTKKIMNIEEIENIQDLYCFKEDSCLLSTLKGIFILDKDKLNKLDYLPSKRINDIEFLEDKNSLLFTIWGEGFHILKEDSLISLSEKDGLFSNTINQIFLDENQTIWLCTNKGINTLKIVDGGVEINKELGVSRILKSPNVLQLYVEDSMMYIGTDRGINIFDLKSERQDINQKLPLRLTSVDVNNIPLKLEKLNYLEYSQNNLTFNFLGISPRQFANIEYKYRLKGLSDEWIYTSECRATFIKVAPGKYEFELQAEDELGNWINLENRPQFVIHKPYWKRWWFIGGVILVILIIVGSFLYYYIANIKKEKHFVENQQLLSEELNESRQKALSAQLNPHFVFNSLNSIQNFILTKRTELSSDYLSTFSKLMRFVFENSKKLYVPLSDEIEALRLYLDLEQVRHNHNFKYRIDSDEGMTLESLYMPSLLVQPIIENAIWHGLLHKQDGNRLLEISFTLDSDYLHIEVKDNGVGRGLSKPRPKFIKKQRSSGVELTKQRLALLSQSTGLKTQFEIVDLFDDKQNPCGTSVIISIPNQL